MSQELKQVEVYWLRAKEKAPKVPPDTCPTLDRISTRFDAVAADIMRIRQEMMAASNRVDDSDMEDTLLEWAEELDSADDALADARKELEKVRKANETLRKSSQHWHVVARQMYKDAVTALKGVVS